MYIDLLYTNLLGRLRASEETPKLYGTFVVLQSKPQTIYECFIVYRFDLLLFT